MLEWLWCQAFSTSIPAYAGLYRRNHRPVSYTHLYSANPLKRILLSDTILRKSIPTSKGIIFLPEDEMEHLIVALVSAPDASMQKEATPEEPSQATPKQPSQAETDSLAPSADSTQNETVFLQRFLSHVHTSGYVYKMCIRDSIWRANVKKQWVLALLEGKEQEILIDIPKGMPVMNIDPCDPDWDIMRKE